MKFRFIRYTLLFGIVALLVDGAPPPANSMGEARYYAGGLGGTRYSPLDQINTSNLKDLKVAWRHPGHRFE